MMEIRFQLAVLVACLAFLAPPASAQSALNPTVDTVGSATVDAPPDFSEFHLTLVASGITLAASTEVLLRFEGELRRALDDQDLVPDEIRMSGTRISDVEGTQASIIARVRFAFVPHSTADERARALASQTDRLRKSINRLKCAVTGPFFGVDEREPIEQQAVSRATENALYQADAVASLMNASIVAVEQATVLEVEWQSGAPDTPWDASDLRRLQCTAQVRVVYRLALP